VQSNYKEVAFSIIKTGIPSTTSKRKPQETQSKKEVSELEKRCLHLGQTIISNKD